MTAAVTQLNRAPSPRRQSIPVPWVKLAGAGNDFVLIDTAQAGLSRLRREWPALARWLCDRRMGIGADGLLILEPRRVGTVRMRIFNPDGSEPSMCGNGIRCVASIAHRHGHAGTTVRIQTRAGLRRAEILGRHRVRVHMGRPRLLKAFADVALGHGHTAQAVLVDSGVPHLVCWVEDVAALDVNTLGRRLRHHPQLGPAGANVDFLQWAAAPPQGGARARVLLRMRTYERGVEAETQACGTGAVAAAAAACTRLLEQPARRTRARLSLEAAVQVPGGILRVDIGARRGRGLQFLPATLEGEARLLTQGTALWNGRHMR